MKRWATPQTMREHAAADRRDSEERVLRMPVEYALFLARRDSVKLPTTGGTAISPDTVKFGNVLIAIPNPDPLPNGGLIEAVIDGVPQSPTASPVIVRQHKHGGGNKGVNDDSAPIVTTYRVYVDGRLVDSRLQKSRAMEYARTLHPTPAYEPNTLAAFMPAKAAALRHAEYAR